MSSVRSDVPLVPLFSPSILIVARAASLFPSSLRHCLRVNLSLASLATNHYSSYNDSCQPLYILHYQQTFTYVKFVNFGH